jgi:hypothetical protein
MESWNFLTSHARVLLRIAHDPGVRLRDIAASLGITGRSAYGIVAGLAAAGYVVKQEDGRRNRCQIQARLPLPETTSQQPAIGEIAALLAGTSARLPVTRTGPAWGPRSRAACTHPGRRPAPGSPARPIRPEVRPGWRLSSLRAADVVRQLANCARRRPCRRIPRANRPATRQDQARVSSHQLRLHVPPAQPGCHSCRCR